MTPLEFWCALNALKNQGHSPAKASVMKVSASVSSRYTRFLWMILKYFSVLISKGDITLRGGIRIAYLCGE